MTRAILTSTLTVLVCSCLHAQQGTKNGEWRYYGGDSGTTKYAPLDQINAGNAKELKIAWQWKSQNFGRRPDFNWEVTPLAIGGVLYFTAGTRRDVELRSRQRYVDLLIDEEALEAFKLCSVLEGIIPVPLGDVITESRM